MAVLHRRARLPYALLRRSSILFSKALSIVQAELAGLDALRHARVPFSSFKSFFNLQFSNTRGSPRVSGFHFCSFFRREEIELRWIGVRTWPSGASSTLHSFVRNEGAVTMRILGLLKREARAHSAEQRRTAVRLFTRFELFRGCLHSVLSFLQVRPLELIRHLRLGCCRCIDINILGQIE